jgi:hypothetical protein
MTNKTAQAQRIAAEMQHTPPAEEIAGRAASLIAHYRLQPDELPDGRHTGRIHSLNTQGVEALTPLAYITGLAKPLPLTEGDVETLVRMSDSPFANDWIGRTVEVRVVSIDGQRVTRLFAPGAVAPPVAPLSAPRTNRRPLLTAVGFVLLLVATALLVLLTEQGVVVWSLLEELFATLNIP